MLRYLILSPFCFISGLYMAYLGIFSLIKDKVMLYPHEHLILWITHVLKPNISQKYPATTPIFRGVVSIVGGVLFLLMGTFFTLYGLWPAIFTDLESSNFFFITVLFLTALVYSIYIPLVIKSRYKKEYLIGIGVSLPFMAYLYLEITQRSILMAFLTTSWCFMLLTMVLPIPLSYYEEMVNIRQDINKKKSKNPKTRNEK
jgi:hypothetical protein